MGKEKDIYEHLEEVRTRIIKSLFAVAIFSILAYIFKDELLAILTKPLARELIFLSPAEPLVALIKLSLIAGFIIAFPYVIYQFWKFVAEVFNKESRRKVVKYLFFSLVLFYGAIVFCYLMVLPIALNFLINFGDFLVPSLTISNYLNFALYLLFSFGIVFQFPLILFALINLNILSIEMLKKQRRYIILIIFIFAAIITPPDAMSLLLLALPMVLLFELTLLIARISIRSNETHQ